MSGIAHSIIICKSDQLGDSADSGSSDNSATMIIFGVFIAALVCIAVAVIARRY